MKWPIYFTGKIIYSNQPIILLDWTKWKNLSPIISEILAHIRSFSHFDKSEYFFKKYFQKWWAITTRAKRVYKKNEKYASGLPIYVSSQIIIPSISFSFVFRITLPPPFFFLSNKNM